MYPRSYELVKQASKKDEDKENKSEFAVPVGALGAGYLLSKGIHRPSKEKGGRVLVPKEDEELKNDFLKLYGVNDDVTLHARSTDWTTYYQGYRDEGKEKGKGKGKLVRDPRVVYKAGDHNGLRHELGHFTIESKLRGIHPSLDIVRRLGFAVGKLGERAVPLSSIVLNAVDAPDDSPISDAVKNHPIATTAVVYAPTMLEEATAWGLAHGHAIKAGKLTARNVLDGADAFGSYIAVPLLAGGAAELTNTAIKKIRSKIKEQKEKQAGIESYELVKTALNAQQAREMAKEYGLIPEGAWRYALRNLRKGKTPQDLGALGRDSYVQVVDAGRAVPRSYEVGALHDKGNLVGGIHQGHQFGMGKEFSDAAGSSNLSSVHTHPGGDGYTGWRAAIPSGHGYYDIGPTRERKALANTPKEEIARLEGQASNSHDVEMERYREATRRASSLNNREVRQRLSDSFFNKQMQLINDQSEAIYKLQDIRAAQAGKPWGQDVGMFAQKDGVSHNIVAPEENIEGVHRVRPQGLRSIYFDHNASDESLMEKQAAPRWVRMLRDNRLSENALETLKTQTLRPAGQVVPADAHRYIDHLGAGAESVVDKVWMPGTGEAARKIHIPSRYWSPERMDAKERIMQQHPNIFGQNYARNGNVFYNQLFKGNTVEDLADAGNVPRINGKSPRRVLEDKIEAANNSMGTPVEWGKNKARLGNDMIQDLHDGNIFVTKDGNVFAHDFIPNDGRKGMFDDPINKEKINRMERVMPPSNPRLQNFYRAHAFNPTMGNAEAFDEMVKATPLAEHPTMNEALGDVHNAFLDRYRGFGHNFRNFNGRNGLFANLNDKGQREAVNDERNGILDFMKKRLQGKFNYDMTNIPYATHRRGGYTLDKNDIVNWRAGQK